jgi:transposase
MSEELPSVKTPEVEDLPSARGLIATLQALITTLHGLIQELRQALAAKETENADLRRALLGPKSERAVRRRREPAPSEISEEERARRRRAAEDKRKSNREARKAQLANEEVDHSAPATCPKCHASGPFTSLTAQTSHEIDYLSERLSLILHRMETNLCPCGHIFSAASPQRVSEGCHYGPGLHAHAVVAKCADALPLNRVSKRFARAGLHMARSTLTDLYHRAAECLLPIYQRLLALVASAEYVNADETSQPVMDDHKCRRGFIWTFIAARIIAYVFSPNRSGETPVTVLQGTAGKLQVDGYTGYNHVCLPDGRERVGCLAHCRRYFYKARDNCLDLADHCLGVIRQLYQVEYDAAEKNVLGSEAHRLMRQHRSKPLMDAWKAWLLEQKGQHTPKSPMGAGIRYTLNQWAFLTRFIDDPKLRLDNNISEAALRIIALGRDNFRWVGHDESGENLAVLQTIVATCVANDVNPQHYIADVLIRVHHTPATDIDSLLPMNWRPPA